MPFRVILDSTMITLLILLFVSLSAISKNNRWFPVVVSAGILFVILLLGSSAIFFSSGALLLVSLYRAYARIPLRAFVISGAMAVVGVYLLIGVGKYFELRKLEEYRRQFPIQSLATRMQPEELILADRPERIPQPSEEWKEKQKTGVPTRYSIYSAREYVLEGLHKRITDEFVIESGFGAVRSSRLRLKAINLPPEPDRTPLPESRFPPFPDLPPGQSQSAAEETELPEVGAVTPEESAEGSEQAPRLANATVTWPEIQSLHDEGEGAFLDRGLFGYIPDRQQAAGFISHRFQQAPNTRLQERWQITRLELIGLVRHADPVAYVSRTLPDLEHLDQFQTRTLTEFESRAVKRFEVGKDLTYEATADQIRLVGVLRAGDDCRKCHSVQWGEPLGALSYDLERIPALEAADSSTDVK